MTNGCDFSIFKNRSCFSDQKAAHLSLKNLSLVFVLVGIGGGEYRSVRKKRRVEGGVWRVECGGWRVECGGWSVEGGGWRVKRYGRSRRVDQKKI